MNLRDALLAASEHGTDRLSIDADRRLRRRLGLESSRAPARRVWLGLAFAAAAAAVIVAVVHARGARPSHVTAAGLVDVSKDRWNGTLTADALDVHATSTASATVAWSDATIVAAPGTRLATRADGDLALAQGAIQIRRSDVTPLVVHVPTGRVVIASYHASIAADVESVTILLEDGAGDYTDATGQRHPLAPGVPLRSPPRAEGSTAPAPVPVPAPPARKPRPQRRATVAPDAAPIAPAASSRPPGLTVPRRPDVPCTFKSDCEPGATCRKNEHGESVCMGNGAAGAACWFDSDCVSRVCDQRRCTAARE